MLTPKEALMAWLKQIQIPQERLSGFAICPFSKQIRGEPAMISTLIEDIEPPKAKDINKILIYHVLDEGITVEELENEVYILNSKYKPELLFLGDHKDRNTYINGVQTNNGHYNFILCQPLEDLRSARKVLAKTPYYSYWDEEYLKEILGEDYGSLD